MAIGFTTKLNEAELAALIKGDLKDRVTELLKRRKQCEAINLVMEEKGVSIIDAVGPVNRIYESIDPIFKQHNGRH